MKLFRSMMIAALTLPLVGAAPAGDSDELVLDIEAPYVTVTVNGAPLKLRVDFDAPADVGGIILNPAAAKRAHLRMELGILAKTCLPEDIEYVAARAGVSIGKKFSSYRKQPVKWGVRNVVDDADGIISPQWLFENRVTLRLHAPVAGEQTIDIPIKVMRYEFGPNSYLSNYVRVGGRVVAISYAPQQPYNIATGAAGAHLAATRDGHWSGEPLAMKLRGGVARPGSPMTLGRGLSLSGLPLRSFLVDTKYLKGAYQLPPADRPANPNPDTAANPDAITVTGKKIIPRGEWSSACDSIEMVLGQETLRSCSSISHDKKRAMLTLRCL